MANAPGFAAMKARRLRTLLEREYGYSVTRSTGSHRVLEAEGRPRLIFAFKDGEELGGALVRSILTRQVHLGLEEAKAVVKRG
jgi:predicted RNA binding protein YcfA (HicA-like mRNA interferase family)